MDQSIEEYIRTNLEYHSANGTVINKNTLKEVSHYLAKEYKGNRGLPCKVVNLHTNGKSKKVFMHRLVWFLCNGSWPKNTIDHIDRDKRNNKIENLRDVTVAENNKNKIAYRKNKTGLKGVSKCGNRYRAQITVSNRTRYLGMFDTPELAARAYDQAAISAYGDGAVVNFP